MKIKLNEKIIEIAEGTSAFSVKEVFKPEADIVILNGFPIHEDQILYEGDSLVLIKRGEIPSKEEMESLMVARHTPGVHEIIKNKIVGIAGAGGLGSNVAVNLARLGVGNIVIADFDVVEPSNLNRQQYFLDDIGKPKVEALYNILNRINPYINIKSYFMKLEESNIENVFKDVNVMVEAFDNPAYKAILVNTFLKKFPDKPIIAASGLAGYGSGNEIKIRKVRNNFYLVGDGVTAAGPFCGLMSPRVSIAAGHQANAVLRLLLGLEP